MDIKNDAKTPPLKKTPNITTHIILYIRKIYQWYEYENLPLFHFILFQTHK